MSCRSYVTFPRDALALTSCQMNLIYLAVLTGRVPILPFFTPSHISLISPVDVPDIDFGQVFDVPRLAKALRIPVVEWWQVKVCYLSVPQTKSTHSGTSGP
jgi:hypothetical protein